MTHYLALDFLSSADQECSRKLNISLDCARPHIIHSNALHQHLRNGNTALIKVALEPKD